jgi:carbon-monoxide dehydrogenase medium subunit
MAREVVEWLVEGGNQVALLMGGTDLFPRLRSGQLRPDVVLDVKHVPGMQELSFDPRRGLTVGAAVTMNRLALHPDVLAHFPILAQAAASVASHQVRNRATLGGNICNASPCGDTLPAMLVLEASFVLLGAKGERVVKAGDFFIGPGKTALKGGEFLAAVRFPPPPTRAAGRYLKLGRSRAGDLALVGVAVFGQRDAAASGARFRIALGSVAPTPVRAPLAEQLLATHNPDEEAFAQAADQAMRESNPISDVRGGADYQRMMVRTLTLRALRQVWEELRSS